MTPPNQSKIHKCQPCLTQWEVGSWFTSDVLRINLALSSLTALKCIHHHSSTLCSMKPNSSLLEDPLNQVLAPSIHPLCLDELDLLKTWYTTTYRSLSRDQGSRHIWRNVVTREALQCPALLNMVFALSALQRACYSSQESSHRKMLSTAKTYWARAQPGLKERSRHPFDETTDISLVAQYNTQLVFSFAYSQQLSPFISDSAVYHMCDIFRHTRESNQVFIGLVDFSQEWDLSSLAVSQETCPKMPHTATLAMLALKRLTSTLRDRKMKSIYTEAIDHLSSCLGYTKHSADPGIAGLSWILRIPSAFLDLLEKHDPLALIVLAHYCVVMFHLRDRWWMGDWGAIVLREIATLLGHDRLSSIEWAVDATGICMGI